MDRVDGYAPIAEYAVIGDGRTAALVASDGSIDWLCLPDVDSAPIFGALLDARRGGRFTLAPAEPFEAERRYVEGTNVLETTFRTASGTARVTDLMTLTDVAQLSPLRELVRSVEGLSGRVPMQWSFEPRFDFGRWRMRLQRRSGQLVADAQSTAAALGWWNAGEAELSGAGAQSSFELGEGERALVTLSATFREPLVFARPEEVERRIERTLSFWREWSGRARYDGPYREQVVRSALALKLLVFAPSGAIVAAPTTSLPEEIGGSRNWDYRFTWLRDASWTLDALLTLGYHEEAHAFFWWFMHASRGTQPRLQILYRTSGSSHVREEELSDLEGYRRSKPVRIGNGAVDQLQLDVYGAVMDSIWLYVRDWRRLDADTGKAVAKIADWVCDNWRRPDAGIWEVRSERTHFTQSKALCAVALERAIVLAGRGVIPDRRERWRRELDQVREFVEERCWDEERGSYVRAPDLPELDASLLTLALLRYDDPSSKRLQKTIDAIVRELGEGPLVYRYRGEDGVEGGEGTFLACAFWLVDSLARCGRRDEAHERMEALLAYGNDVGLFSEEADASSGELLGNFPQGLTHLALINAAATLAGEDRAR